MTLKAQYVEQTLLVLSYLAYKSLYIFSHIASLMIFTQYKMQNSEIFSFNFWCQMFFAKFIISNNMLWLYVQCNMQIGEIDTFVVWISQIKYCIFSKYLIL
jgi:hypothetical protein